LREKWDENSNNNSEVPKSKSGISKTNFMRPSVRVHIFIKTALVLAVLAVLAELGTGRAGSASPSSL